MEIYNGIKLSGGGELGVGVGEEEWGSGEREVLEGFVTRTEGLVDLVVGRYGDEPVATSKEDNTNTRTNTHGPPPWLGNGESIRASDGVIFSGTGAVSRRSLITVSQWMETIFKEGSGAYGIGDNPNARPRHRRKRRRVVNESSSKKPTSSREDSQMRSAHGHGTDLRRRAMKNNATTPGIPAPLVGAVEQSLNDAVSKSQQRQESPNPKKEKIEEALDGGQTHAQPSLFGTDKMMKYLSLGYGSSWTLNPRGFSSENTDEQTPNAETISDNTQTNSINGQAKQDKDEAMGREAHLDHVDPTPEVSDDERTFVQRLEQSIGKFIIGLSGDLENADFDSDADEDENEMSNVSQKEQRIYLRTLMVEMTRHRLGDRASLDRSSSRASRDSAGSMRSTNDPKTSASASVDGAQPNISHEKLQVAIYVHQPFVFVFLFELHTPSLTIPSFYRNIHHQLGPLQTPLLRSTDPARVAGRMAGLMGNEHSTTVAQGGVESNNIYDVIYDPVKMTVRTTVPNIPIPGSLAAEGLASRSSTVTVSGSWYTLGIPIGNSIPSASQATPEKLVQSDWTRVDAINAHTQILNTWSATRNTSELERTVKTGRGWWVLWIKVPSNNNTQFKEAFIVRKAVGIARDARGGGSGRWLLKEQSRDGTGNDASNSATSAKGMSEGVGLDARKWVEGLMHLD